jgi:plasmid stabilization system protein ParE
MHVIWSDAAIENLADIYQHIATNSPQFAQTMVDRITARSKQISTFPNSGSVVGMYGAPQIREVIEGPYRVIYRVESDAVYVLSVIHGARQLPPLP